MKQHCCELFADKVREPDALGITFAEGLVGLNPAVFMQMRSCDAIDEGKISTAIRDGVLKLNSTIRLSSRQAIQFCPFCGARIVIQH